MAARDGRGLAWGAAALVALVAAVAWLSRERRPEPPLGADALRPTPAGAPAQPLDTPAPSEIVAGAPPAERVAPQPDGPAAAAAHEGVLVRVVRASDGEPLAGAEVRVFDPATVDWLELEERVGHASLRHETAAKHFFSSWIADSDGLVRVPHPTRDGSVRATHGGLWGRAPLTPLSEEVVLSLEPDLALAVLVTGADGPVGGIEVLLWRDQYVEDRERTGPDGRARFEHVASLRELAREHGLELRVTTGVLALDAPETRIDPEAWPSGVTLALPPTGALRFEVVEPDGKLSSAGVEIELAIDGALRARLGREPPVVDKTIRLAHGAARIEPIGLGLELPFAVRAHGWAELRGVARGPEEPGEETLVILRPTSPAPVVRGRLLGRDGSPLPHASLGCEIHGEKHATPRIERVRTDGLGRFDGLGGPYLLDEGSWRLFLSIAGDAESAARIELRGPVEPRVHDFGDVVLEPPPRVADGKVVDGRGRPVRAARVEVEEEIARPWLTRGPSWHGMPRGIDTTDAEGRFEVRSWPEGERLRLRVRREGFVTFGPHELQAPRAGWTIALVDEGAIAGRVLGAPAPLRGLFDFQLTREGGYGTDRPTTFGDGGSFRIGGLSAGVYDLELTLFGSPSIASFRLPDIVVRGGETTELEALRFEDLVHELELDVIDETGARIDGVRLSARIGERTLDWVPVIASDGATLLRTLELPIAEVTVSAPGFRSTTLTDLRTDQRVVLSPGALVRLVLSDALVVGEAWSAWARPTRDGVDEPAVPFDAAGVATARLSGPGRYWVQVAFRRPDERGFATVDGLGWHVDVADTDAEQTFTIPPFPPEVLAGLERFSR